jgi:hypothetical protein
MKKSVVFVLCGLLFLPVLVSAQGLSGGAKGGVVLSNAGDITDPVNGELLVTGSRWGATGGVFGAYTWENGGSIQVEGLFSQKGVTADSDSGDLSLRFDIIEFPILAKYIGGSERVKGFAMTGPSIGFVNKTTMDLADVSTDVSDDYKSSEFSWVFGTGMEIDHFLIEARYTHGFTNLSKLDDNSIKTRSFIFMVGVRF